MRTGGAGKERSWKGAKLGRGGARKGRSWDGVGLGRSGAEKVVHFCVAVLQWTIPVCMSMHLIILKCQLIEVHDLQLVYYVSHS